MNTLLVTFLLAAVTMVVCVICLAIGKLLTGKTLKLKRCGKPECNKKEDKCSLCQRKRTE